VLTAATLVDWGNFIGQLIQLLAKLQVVLLFEQHPVHVGIVVGVPAHVVAHTAMSLPTHEALSTRQILIAPSRRDSDEPATKQIFGLAAG
jgi:hypothetical protein